MRCHILYSLALRSWTNNPIFRTSGRPSRALLVDTHSDAHNLNQVQAVRAGEKLRSFRNVPYYLLLSISIYRVVVVVVIMGISGNY